MFEVMSKPDDLPVSHKFDPISLLIEEHGLDSVAVHEGIAKGEKAISEGRTVSQEDAKLRMAKWLEKN